MKYWFIDFVLEETYIERGHASGESPLRRKGQVRSNLASELYRLILAR
jgi:hypothetical protein